MNPLIQLKKAILAFIIALTCFGLSPMAQALLPPPPPDGDYSTGDMAQVLGDNMAVGADTLCNMMMLGNTPYGCNALEGNGTGVRNTAIGYRTLVHNAMGNRNTAIGFGALRDNAMGNNNTAIGFVALGCNTGSGNIALGESAGDYHMTGNNNIYIGNRV